MNTVRDNPIATSTLSITAVASLLTWISNDLLDWGIPAYAAVAITGVISTALAAVGSEGLLGLWDRLLHGKTIL